MITYNMLESRRTGRRFTHEIRVSGECVACKDGGTDASDELFARHDLLAHEMSASLGLDLVLDV